MTKLELINEIRKLKLANAKILDDVAADKRNLTNVETLTLESNKEQIQELESRMNSVVEPTIETPQKKTESFNLLQAVREIAENRQLSDATKEINQRGLEAFKKAGITPKGNLVLPSTEELRAAYNAGTATEGKELIGVEKMAVIGELRNNLVLNEAGARIVTGLEGIVAIPKHSGVSVGWALENANAANGAGATSELTMSPFRLTSYVDVSKLLLAQSSTDAQQMLIDSINGAVAETLEESVLGTFSGSTTQPAGAFKAVTATGATSYATFVGLESTLTTANAAKGKMVYIVHPKIAGAMKTTPKFTNGETPILQGGEANGYKVLSTSAMPKSGDNYLTAFGNWNDLIIGQWAGTEITVDSISQAIAGKVRLVVNTYWNWVKTRDESFTAKFLAE